VGAASRARLSKSGAARNAQTEGKILMNVQLEIQLQQTRDPNEALTILTLGKWADLSGIDITEFAAANVIGREGRIN
jgi:hypothetical protein